MKPEPWVIETRDASIPRDDGDTARAWIVTPVPRDGSGPAPGVVLVHGAGTATRDAMLAEAERLARSGVAAIVYDKRREGYSFTSRDYPQLAADVVDAANLLAAQPDVDSTRIGLYGFSEGGWVTLIAAGRVPDRFAFLILVSATIVSPLDEIAWAVDHRLRSWPDWVRRIPAAALASGGSFLDYTNTDVTTEMKALTVPVYAVWGGDDTSIPVAAAVRALMRDAASPVLARIVPYTGHDLGAGPWLDDAAVWVAALPASSRDQIVGVEPASNLGLGTLPEPVWYLNPFGHAAMAFALAVGSWFLPSRNTSTPKKPRSS